MKLVNGITFLFFIYLILDYISADCLQGELFSLHTEHEPIIFNYTKHSVEFIYPKINVACPYDHMEYEIHVICPGNTIEIHDDEHKIQDCQGSTHLIRKPKWPYSSPIHLKSCREWIPQIGHIKCKQKAIFSMKQNRNRYLSFDLYSVGYKISILDFLTTYYLMNEMHELYGGIHARVKLLSITEERQKLKEEIAYEEGIIYSNANYIENANLREVYSKLYQIAKFQESIEGTVVEQYFSDENYLVQGQLISKDDLFYLSQQKTTFYYENTVPIWRSINEGNWKTIGDIVRRLAFDSGRDFEIWVFPIGSLKIKSSEVTLVDVRSSRAYLKIPQVIAKVAVDVINRSRGMVFHTFNDPYIEIGEVKRIFQYNNLCKRTLSCEEDYPHFLEAKKGITICCSLEDSHIWDIFRGRWGTAFSS